VEYSVDNTTPAWPVILAGVDDKDELSVGGRLPFGCT
jgi:hypothetical protein